MALPYEEFLYLLEDEEEKKKKEEKAKKRRRAGRGEVEGATTEEVEREQTRKAQESKKRREEKKKAEPKPQPKPQPKSKPKSKPKPKGRAKEEKGPRKRKADELTEKDKRLLSSMMMDMARYVAQWWAKQHASPEEYGRNPIDWTRDQVKRLLGKDDDNEPPTGGVGGGGGLVELPEWEQNLDNIGMALALLGTLGSAGLGAPALAAAAAGFTPPSLEDYVPEMAEMWKNLEWLQEARKQEVPEYRYEDLPFSPNEASDLSEAYRAWQEWASSVGEGYNQPGYQPYEPLLSLLGMEPPQGVEDWFPLSATEPLSGAQTLELPPWFPESAGVPEGEPLALPEGGEEGVGSEGGEGGDEGIPPSLISPPLPPFGGIGELVAYFAKQGQQPFPEPLPGQPEIFPWLVTPTGVGGFTAFPWLNTEDAAAPVPEPEFPAFDYSEMPEPSKGAFEAPETVTPQEVYDLLSTIMPEGLETPPEAPAPQGVYEALSGLVPEGLETPPEIVTPQEVYDLLSTIMPERMEQPPQPERPVMPEETMPISSYEGWMPKLLETPPQTVTPQEVYETLSSLLPERMEQAPVVVEGADFGEAPVVSPGGGEIPIETGPTGGAVPFVGELPEGAEAPPVVTEAGQVPIETGASGSGVGMWLNLPQTGPVFIPFEYQQEMFQGGVQAIVPETGPYGEPISEPVVGTWLVSPEVGPVFLPISSPERMETVVDRPVMPEETMPVTSYEGWVPELLQTPPQPTGQPEPFVEYQLMSVIPEGLEMPLAPPTATPQVTGEATVGAGIMPPEQQQQYLPFVQAGAQPPVTGQATVDAGVVPSVTGQATVGAGIVPSSAPSVDEIAGIMGGADKEQQEAPPPIPPEPGAGVQPPVGGGGGVQPPGTGGGRGTTPVPSRGREAAPVSNRGREAVPVPNRGREAKELPPGVVGQPVPPEPVGGVVGEPASGVIEPRAISTATGEASTAGGARVWNAPQAVSGGFRPGRATFWPWVPEDIVNSQGEQYAKAQDPYRAGREDQVYEYWDPLTGQFYRIDAQTGETLTREEYYRRYHPEYYQKVYVEGRGNPPPPESPVPSNPPAPQNVPNYGYGSGGWGGGATPATQSDIGSLAWWPTSSSIQPLLRGWASWLKELLESSPEMPPNPFAMDNEAMAALSNIDASGPGVYPGYSTSLEVIQDLQRRLGIEFGEDEGPLSMWQRVINAIPRAGLAEQQMLASLRYDPNTKSWYSVDIGQLLNPKYT